MAETKQKRSSAVRRYPGLVLLAAAAALAILLPSALNVPQSGPSTLAEFAPVPGQGQGQSDVSDLGQGSSGGLGFGAGQGRSADVGQGADKGPVQKKAKLKRCVGSPPRQTEDPLSPPCVAFFDGDNGGSTAKGVTTDEVVVAMPSDGDDKGPGARIVDCNAQPAADDTANDSMCKAYMRYFNDRYQTYGRIVHLYSTLVPEITVDERLRPFGRLGSLSGKRYSNLGVAFSGAQRESYRKEAPHAISFRADLEDTAAIGASFACTKLAGRTARYSGTPLDRTRTRIFGLAMARGAQRELLLADLRQRCNLVPAATTDNSVTDTTAVARFVEAGVTTVIITAENSGAATVMTRQATSVGWFPEWFVPGEPGGRGIDRNSAVRTADQSQWANAFGITLDVRRGSIPEQSWYRGYREGCPTCPEPRSFTTASFQYDMLNLLFYGVQAAGPRLTLASLDKGLHAIPPTASSDPFKPAAYFAPGNYSFVKDATTIRWDISGQAPGAIQPGCYRLPDGGQRRRAGEWPAGDDDLATASASPCQGDTVQ